MTQFRNYANLGVEKKHIRNYERGNMRGGQNSYKCRNPLQGTTANLIYYKQIKQEKTCHVKR